MQATTAVEDRALPLPTLGRVGLARLPDGRRLHLNDGPIDLILDADKPDYLARLRDAGGVPMSFNWEGRIRVRAWKDVKWVNLRVRQRDTPDGTLWDGIMLNVTQSHLRESQLLNLSSDLRQIASHLESVREAERAATESKQTLVSQLGHDIRTPLASLGATAELLAVGESDPVRRERLAVIRAKVGQI